MKYGYDKARNLSASMKRFAVILFSLVPIYGGVAWALEKCLSHDSQHQHSSPALASHQHSSTELPDSHGTSHQVIHCPSSDLRIGPAAQSGSIQLSRGNRVMTVHMSLIYPHAATTIKNSLWLDAVFRRNSPLSRFDALGLHLLFSVLQI